MEWQNPGVRTTFCEKKSQKLEFGLWSKFKSWDGLELGELKFFSQKKQKVSKVGFWYGQH
jgi:hypothetical protein